ncbi:MAG: nucleoside deaminase [Clostridia bacterium]|nr:nucleoside deaminase [Clostridia bacterium]
MTQDEKYMKVALAQAQKAYQQNEVPIGAVLVIDGKIVSRAYNSRNKSHDATAHAEVNAIRKACKKIGDWRLENSVLYVTLEPCPMCFGACLNARVEKVVYGAKETGSQTPNVLSAVNHKMQVEGGVLSQQCADILKSYFKSKRV